MPSDSKFTRDDDGNVAVRVVSNTGVSEQPESMFTTDEDGNVAVRVVFGEGGGGGSDQHNLGWYATQAALEEAYPTANAGDWAIVGATDTVWIWDTDNEEWVDSDQKGQVTSVNGQTGDVVLDLLPSQTGQSGKFLTTDGTDASWSDKPLVNTATEANTISILGNTGNAQQAVCVGINSDATYDGAVAIGFNADVTGGNAIAIGREAKGEGPYGVAIGSTTRARGNLDISIGMGAGSSSSTTKKNRMCIGYYAQALAHGAYQFGYGTNSEAGTVCFSLNTTGTTAANDWHNYKLLDSDGTIPEARLADTTNAQEGDVLTLDSNGNAVWQAGGSGLPDQTGQSGKFLTTDGTDASWGDALANKATGTECLTICGNVATGAYDTNVGYRSKASGNGAAFGFNAVVYDGGVACGRWAQATGPSSTAVGNMVTAGGSYSVAIGCEAKTTANYAIQISSKYGHTNADTNTFKVGNNNGNFEMMSADGTIPTARLTKVNSTITLTAADWSSNTQTVNVTGMTANGVVFVSPDPTDQSAYTSAGVLCTAQAAGTLTFTCDTVPSGDIDVNVVCL